MLPESVCYSVANANRQPPLQINSGRYLNIGGGAGRYRLHRLLLWAGLAPLDKGVAVTGLLVVAENRKVIQPLQGAYSATACH